MSYQDTQYVEPVAELLSAAHAPLGVIAILGNHDDDRVVPAALSRRGITVLKDARTRLTRNGASLEIAGVRFWTKTLNEVAGVVAGARGPVLLLAHDPRRVIEARALGIPAVLSGHTHGGQVVLPVVGALAARKFPVAAGRLSVNGTELYVSAGVGTVILPSPHQLPAGGRDRDPADVASLNPWKLHHFQRADSEEKRFWDPAAPDCTGCASAPFSW